MRAGASRAYPGLEPGRDVYVMRGVGPLSRQCGEWPSLLGSGLLFFRLRKFGTLSRTLYLLRYQDGTADGWSREPGHITAP